MSGQARRLQYIDSLRGIAALGVAYFHIAQYMVGIGQIPANSGIAGFVLSIDLGRLGVILFFVISGFVIPPTITSIRRFAISRFFRLYPAYWASLIFAILVFGSDMRTALANATMLQGFLGFRDLNLVYWTLGMELVFYVVCAALFSMRLLHSRTAIVGCALATLYLWVNGMFGGWLVFMFLGSLLRFVVPKGDFGAKPLVWLGEISYSIYILHLPILMFLHHAKRHDAFFLLLSKVPASVQEALFLVMVILASWLSYRYIEKPCIGLASRFSSMTTLRPSAA